MVAQKEMAPLYTRLCTGEGKGAPEGIKGAAWESYARKDCSNGRERWNASHQASRLSISGTSRWTLDPLGVFRALSRASRVPSGRPDDFDIETLLEKLFEKLGAPDTSREVLKIGYLHGLLLLLCDHLAQNEILPQSTERIVEVQGTPEGLKGAIWEICKCLDDEDLQGRTRAETGSRKDHRRCKFKYYQRRQSRSKYRNVYRCKGYPGNHDCKNMLYNPVVCTQSDTAYMASISHFSKQQTR
ncbi:KH domain-containing protein [Colletotrichum scovillei]|uniref:KH domain-containing protein n=1 Tax=Colletotrichum scovillei TaxID=1209932 RepID=A0A9P7U4P1_9PEZI|nr:KH domain-containing protein [Colletotrichum scovillei]KAG7041816.1 KH domain-containing protein [Colletotrichum scovillei]KAG7061848.1 KH domain-containing protein [Colletotrichum scovillei]